VPSAVPPSFGVCRTRPDGSEAGTARCRPIGATGIAGARAGAYWTSARLAPSRPDEPAFGPEAHGSIRRRRRPGSHQPPGLWIGRSTGTRPDRRPLFVMVAGV